VLAARGERSAATAQLAEARRVLSSARDAGAVPRRVEEAARRLGERPPAPATGEPLSERELRVLRLLATELSQRDIGRELYVSLNTVKTHSKHIFRKLGVSTRTEAVERARELELL
jgi:LuxR family maltose regulon positive regulatory protein